MTLEGHENDANEEPTKDEDPDVLLTVHEGLSAETLLALMEFQHNGGSWHNNDNDDDEDREEEGAEVNSSNRMIDTKAICVAYTAKDSQVIAETLKRLQEKAENESKNCQITLQQQEIPSLQAPAVISEIEHDDNDNTLLHLSVLERDGVVRINNVLDGDLCDACLKSVNAALEQSSSLPSSGTSSKEDECHPHQFGFGNVFSRNCRYDMYLRPTGVYLQALQQLLHYEHSSLGLMLQQCAAAASPTAPRSEVVFHELSCLIADPGCENQPIHPDAPYTLLAPLWTVFVALQDISWDLGPTVLLLESHLLDIPDLVSSSYNSNSSSSPPPLPSAMNPIDHSQYHLHMSDSQSYRQATLNRGDCIVMDARTLHFGSANTTASTRRALLYLTLRNPQHGSHDDDFPPNGSLFPDLKHLRLSDFDGR